MNTLNKVLENINIYDSQHYKNMTVIGLNIPGGNNLDLMSLEIGLNMGLVEISETSESGNVSEVKVINNAVTSLLILDGEEIIGSKQNRIVNTTVIIPAKSQKIIPVSCTERGRWDYKTTKFHYSNHMATSRVRRDKQRSVTDSLKNYRGFKSDQSEVWNNIDCIENELSMKSDTNALHDSYTQKNNEILQYKKAFKMQKNQNGLIVYINGQIAGLEIIYSTSRYKQYHEKLMESYILDAIARKDEEISKENISEKEFIEEIKSLTPETYKSVGLGEDLRIENNKITGSAMIYDDKLINASFFRKIKA